MDIIVNTEQVIDPTYVRQECTLLRKKDEIVYYFPRTMERKYRFY